MPDEAASGGDFPHRDNPSLEARVTILEMAVAEIRKELQAIRLELAEMRGEIRGKLSNLPTTFQLVFIQATFVVAIFAAAFGIVKLAGVH